MSRSLSLMLVGLAYGLSGCGSNSHSSGEDTEKGPPSGSSGADSGEVHATLGSDSSGERPTSEGDPPVSPVDCTSKPLELGFSRLQRLSPAQYNASVKALFAPATIDEQPLQESPQTFGFRHFGAQQNPSSLVIQEFQQAALKVSEQAMAQVSVWSGCSSDAASQTQLCGQEFLRAFIPRAFRRPQSEESLGPYLRFFGQKFTEHNFEVALALTIQSVLQAPEFLYFLDQSTPTKNAGIEKLDSFSLASRMSFLLWNSIPDQVLWQAAEQDELSTQAQVEAQARRMLADPRARSTIASFFRQWLDSDRIDRIRLDLATYPSYQPSINSLLLEGLERRIEHNVFEDKGNLRSLLTGRQAWVHPQLAPLYGVEAPKSGSWELLSLPPTQRAGLLTDVGWLASRAHAVHPSPVARGVFVLERLLCRPSYPPPADTDTTPPKSDPQTPTTNRQRYEQHVLDSRCAGCHKPIDGIGMGFEHYDSFGRWRDQDNGFAVDASGVLVSPKADRSFEGALELSRMLSEDLEVHHCVARQLFRYSMGRDPQDGDECQFSEQTQHFSRTEGHFLEQLVAIVAGPAFRHRKVEPTP